MKLKLLAAFAAGLFYTVSSASAVTLAFGVDRLTTSTLTPVPVSTLAILVVLNGPGAFLDPTGGANLQAGTYLTGGAGAGSYVAWSGNLSGSGVAGVFSQAINLTIDSPNLPANAPIGLYWFEGLTTSALTLPAGTKYGFYTSTNASQFGSESSWNLGSVNGATYTINAVSVNNSGNVLPNPPLVGGLADAVLSATNIVAVPEPTTVGLFGAAACLALVLRRRLRRA